MGRRKRERYTKYINAKNRLLDFMVRYRNYKLPTYLLLLFLYLRLTNQIDWKIYFVLAPYIIYVGYYIVLLFLKLLITLRLKLFKVGSIKMRDGREIIRYNKHDGSFMKIKFEEVKRGDIIEIYDNRMLYTVDDYDLWKCISRHFIMNDGDTYIDIIPIDRGAILRS